MKTKISDFVINEKANIVEAIRQIDKNGKGIVLIINSQGHMLGTITDGDIRRAILRQVDLNSPILSIVSKKSAMYAKPVTARLGTDVNTLIQVMKAYSIKQVPMVDDQDRVVDLVTWDELISPSETGLIGVVMAGGFGKRLEPLTNNIPKPMLKIGGKPLLELIVLKLKNAGIKEIYITTHYHSEKIVEHFGNGEAFGLKIKYLEEEQPLGTAGSLRLLPNLKKPLVVMNGDILTSVDLNAMWFFHQSNNADLSVAVREYIHTIPYGVIELEGNFIRSLDEKPVIRKFINAGIYIINPDLISNIPQTTPFDMTELIQMVIQKGCKTASFPIIEYWLDIGRQDDYYQAKGDFEEGKLAF